MGEGRHYGNGASCDESSKKKKKHSLFVFKSVRTDGTGGRHERGNRNARPMEQDVERLSFHDGLMQ